MTSHTPGARHIPTPASDTALAGHHVTPDVSLRRHAGGRVMLGGSPTRLLRLTTHGATLLDRWCAGQPIGTAPRETALARRLLDAGLIHPEPRPGRYTPADVTVVVPVNDNPHGLARLRAATGDLTTIVVDDGSTAPLLDATLRHRTPAGPAAARNTGWRQASTDLVAFLDADTLPEPDWLEAILGLFDDPDVAAAALRCV
ncbi:glycosyltransferase [Haloechinothrix salitolerans]|uniref:Glycosyltransferase n=1 Tax=Haloechinothrix salitolerans TaxID=926830 RepID=A0ABW2C1L1_9PSEU